MLITKLPGQVMTEPRLDTSFAFALDFDFIASLNDLGFPKLRNLCWICLAVVKYVENDQSLSAAVHFSEASMKVHFSPDFTTRPTAYIHYLLTFLLNSPLDAQVVDWIEMDPLQNLDGSKAALNIKLQFAMQYVYIIYKIYSR